MLTAMTMALALTGTALADGREVVKHGHGSKGSAWTLEVDDDGAYLEVDLEIRTGKAGQAWRIVLHDDGKTFFSGVRTSAHDGQVEVDRLVKDHAGSDTISFRAVNLVNGEVCRGKATI